MDVSTTLQDLERLKQLYTGGLHDAFLDSALHKITSRQITRDRVDLQRVNDVIAQFEHQYGLSADDFWRRFQSGEMADTADFMEWNVFYKMRQRILSRLRILCGNGADE